MTVIRTLFLGVLVLVGTAATADASPLTLYFSGSVDMSISGGPADNPFSGFFTWDTDQAPAGTEGTGVAFYPLVDYKLTFDGVEPDPALGAGLILFNDVDAFGDGSDHDGLAFFAPMKEDAVVNGVQGEMAFIGGFSGPTTLWDGLSLPTDYTFLTQMTLFSAVSLEVPFQGDENDVLLGSGSLDAHPVPEPASLTLTALGLAGAIARGRRRGQRR